MSATVARSHGGDGADPPPPPDPTRVPTSCETGNIL